MGFLDDIMAKLGGQQGQEGGLSAITKLFNSNGGLQATTAKMSQNGLPVQSWVGTGQNQPVTGPQLQQALDPKYLDQVAQQSGTTPEEASENLAQALPHIVDQATPQGQVPDNDPFAKGMGALKKMFAK